MAKPDPQGGLVIRYDYLWLWEKQKGRVDGSKQRPCAVVISVPEKGKKPLRALVCGITHSEPGLPEEGIELPTKVKAHLGLDADRSWIIVSEANLVEWDDPGIVPTQSGDWSYGFLPPSLAGEIAKRVLNRHNSGRLPLVRRATE
jgi:hypothetical protein